jgi:HemY protein
MRRWLIVVLLAALAGLGLTRLLQQDPGYVLIAWGDYSVEMSMWTGVFLLLVGIAVASLLLVAIRESRLLRRRFGAWRQGRNFDLNLSRASRGMIAYSEGYWGRARKLLGQAAENSDNGVVYYLFAARASHAMGEQRDSERLLAQAAEGGGSAATAAALTRAELQLADGDAQACLATLLRAGDAMTHPAGLKLQVAVYRELGDWQQLRDLMPRLKKARLLAPEQLHTLQLEVFVQLLRRAGKDETSLAAVWRTVPKTLVEELPLVEAYVEALLSIGDTAAAEAYIRTALRRSWNDELALLYGKLKTDHPDKQLERARKWLKGREDNGVLLLTLGRLSLANKLWGVAREYFERSLAVRPDPETYAELGRLLVGLGKSSASLEHFQRGLLQSAPALPELPLPG